MSLLKRKHTLAIAAVLIVVIIGSYAYIASRPTAEEILKKQKEEEYAVRQKEFQKVLTFLTTRDANKPLGYAEGARGSAQRQVLKETYEALVRYEGTSLDFKPALAEKWEISPDGKSITFYLRKGVKFYPSGDPFNAEVVKWNYDSSFREDTLAPIDVFNPEWLQYDRCEIIDEYTVRIHIKKPCSWFPTVASHINVGAIMNPKFMNAHGGIPKSLADVDPYLMDHQDVTGPYIIEELKPGDRIILKRNPTYWGGWTGEKANRPERVVIRRVTETSTRMMLLGRGDADIGFIDIPYIPELKKRIQTENLPLVIDEEPSPRVFHILFDQKAPPTNDVHIRRAFAWAFNYDKFIEKILYGFGVRLISFVPKGMWGYQSDIPHYTFNLDKAKAELELAKPENRKMVEEGITVTYTPGYALGKEAYLMWKADLAKIGVNLILEEVAYSVYRDIYHSGGRPIVDRQWRPDFPDPATFYIFLTKQYFISKSFGTTPDNINNILTKAALEPNPENRLKIYRQVEEWLFDSATYIKVASPYGGNDYNVRGSWVKGFHPHPVPEYKSALFYEIWKELPTEERKTGQAMICLMTSGTIRKELVEL
jgi:ABC-type transport system substrate-binding protein